jgi:hypothetical protein
MGETKTYTGACHCGAVKFEVEADLDTIIECNCTHCWSKGLNLAFAPRSAFRFVEGEDRLSEYRFNKHAIEHRFCQTCGVQPFGFGDDPKTGAPTVAVNVRILQGVEPWSYETYRFDGRSQL